MPTCHEVTSLLREVLQYWWFNTGKLAFLALKNHHCAFYGSEEAFPVIVSPHKQNLKSGTD